MLLKSLLLGLLAALAALLITNLSSGSGTRVNTESWPASAKSILAERPGEPISIEQWRRIETALAKSGDNAGASHLVTAEVRKGWPVVLLAALLALVCVRWQLKAQSLGAALSALLPSALLLVVAFAHTHPYYR
jgi:hypothetical protein